MVQRIVAWVAVPLLCVLAGCEIPAQVYWSPDGSRAAYVPSTGSEAPAAVIDAEGNIVGKLAPSVGGFAWSKDSKKLYFCAMGPRPQGLAPTPIRRGWENVPTDLAIPPTQPAENNDQGVVVAAWEEGKSTPLFNLPRGLPYYMVLSPDQQFLALVVSDEKWAALFVYSIPSKQLSLLSFQCGKAACFTGPHRLAFVEPTEMFGERPEAIGQLVEVNLDDQAQKLERMRLVIVATTFTSWIQPVGDDILFTTFPFTIPGIPPQESEPNNLGLFRYSRADNSVKNVAESAGQFFMPSPNGKRVLFEKVHNHADPASRGSDLALLDLTTGKSHVVTDGKVAVQDANGALHSGMPAFPAWRNDDEVSFVSPADPAKPAVQQGERFYFDLSLFRLTPEFKLSEVRKLSGKWPLEMKPSIGAK